MNVGRPTTFVTESMGKDKLRKWEENKAFPHVFEPPLLPVIRGHEEYAGKGLWRRDVFRNDRPIVLELGCGKGEYTVGLARRYPGVNFIGVDVKGHRFHKGARESHLAGMSNVSFLRTRVEFIQAFFGPGEIDEIWITFCDPFPLDRSGHRRMTSPWYLDKYRKICKPDFLIHLKHDNADLFSRTRKEWEESGLEILMASDDIYGLFGDEVDESTRDLLGIRTFYETMWLEEGRKITYLRARNQPGSCET
ncbi:MAG: tRNA (guanosine(46)-N7)-methyltransferase TrmB [Bacteroidota bacterium]